jgi:hypothetical protein
VCTEVVQKIPSEQASATPATPLKAAPVVGTIPILSTTTTSTEGISIKGDGHDNVTTLLDAGTARDDVLRQRLKKAMGSMGG